jgi:hypothetical protein
MPLQLHSVLHDLLHVQNVQNTDHSHATKHIEDNAGFLTVVMMATATLQLGMFQAKGVNRGP